MKVSKINQSNISIKI